MPVEPEVVLGLRERKKLRTRATIREQAMRLFAEKGYGETTIEQIAEAAEVSPSTLFRYFPSKEHLALTDDLDPIMIRSFKHQPAELPVLAALRRSMHETLESLTPEQWERERTRQQLIITVPELRAAQLAELERTVGMVATAVADRLHRPPDDLECRVFAGAVIGAVFGAVGFHGVFTLEKIDGALDLLEAGALFK